jgi:hypothetical protein
MMTHFLVKLCRDLGRQEWAENNVGVELDELVDQVRSTVGTLGSGVEDFDSDIPQRRSPFLQSSITELCERVDASTQQNDSKIRNALRNLDGTPHGTEGFAAIAIVDWADMYFLSGKIHGAGWTRGPSRGIEDIGEVGNGSL